MICIIEGGAAKRQEKMKKPTYVGKWLAYAIASAGKLRLRRSSGGRTGRRKFVRQCLGFAATAEISSRGEGGEGEENGIRTGLGDGGGGVDGDLGIEAQMEGKPGRAVI